MTIDDVIDDNLNMFAGTYHVNVFKIVGIQQVEVQAISPEQALHFACNSIDDDTWQKPEADLLAVPVSFVSLKNGEVRH